MMLKKTIYIFATFIVLITSASLTAFGDDVFYMAGTSLQPKTAH